MKYYKMMYNGQHNDVDNWINCIKPDIKNNDKYALLESKPITNWQTPSFEIDKDDGKILTDLISNVYNWRIVSPKFINLMQDLIKDCVQYLDVEIKSQEINYYDCKIMHVIKSLEALDYEHSVYTYMGDNDEYLSITKAVLKKSKLDGSHIFRIKDDEIPVFVSSEFRKIVRENNLLGFSFSEVMVYEN
ncbi:hypothetical protein FYH20_09715 [Campylobacter coli]|nr:MULTISPECIES: DUF1629 domain-containing protein [Campylobacter]EAH4708512.1 hypothetical protein [Campylobacter jejuni]EAH5304942.1 hypothetical protein [Campylobacter jejuni]EAH7260533.1 hypothetical protein [Campylobacter jejuni]EAH9535528.1 hypothetical protein [Campylobacter jejuni]EAH9578651.1 hypothetical protein [Campylobacter jejuni]